MLDSILSIFLKSNCPLCKRATDNLVCEYCQQKLRSCQLNYEQNLSDSSRFLFAWGKYDYSLKQAIASFKYDKHKELGELLGTWLGETWIKLGKKKQYSQLIIIPIPLHPNKLKTRGFNQAELIARSFCDVTNYQLKNDVLIRIKDTEAMFSLSPEEKLKNIDQAFKLGKNYSKINTSQKILIIDDIYTTGATIQEAIKILNKGNLNTIGVATICVTKS